MVNESRTFGAATLVSIVGLLIMLYGVSIDNGQELNGIMLVGGAVIIVGFSLLTGGIMLVDSDHAEA